MAEFSLDIVEKKKKKTVGKGENAGYQYFLLFSHCLKKASFPGHSNMGLFGYVTPISRSIALEYLVFNFSFLSVWLDFTD